MWMKSKLQAFTLLEMLVASAITTMVMLMAGYSFRVINDMSGKFKHGIETSESSYLILSELESRFLREEQVMLRFREVRFAGVQYELEPEWLLRKQENVTDTFRIEFKEPLLVHLQRTDHPNYTMEDRFSFQNEKGVFLVSRRSSIVDLINSTVHGKD